jgi:MFS transporter, YNFM family, putative membrane transport protein
MNIMKAGKPMKTMPTVTDNGTDGRKGTLVALFVIGLGTFLGLYVTQPLLPEFQKIFHASELLVSLTISASVLGVAITSPVAGLLSDAVGRKKIIVFAMLCLAFFTALAATSSNLRQLVIWRFFQGLFLAGIPSATMAYISEESSVRLVGSTMATYITGGVIGGFAGRLIAGFSVVHYGWRFSFIILGAITLAGALIIWSFLPDSRKFVRQRNLFQALFPMLKHFRNKQLLATYAVGFNVLFCLVAAFTYANFYLADRPFFLGPKHLASIFAVYLVGAVITLPAGRVMDRVGQRKALIGAVFVSATGMMLTLVHSVSIIIAGLALEATGVFTCQAASSSHVGNVAHDARSSAAGLYIFFYYLGGFAGAILPGFIWNYTGWTGCVVLMLCMQAIAVLIAALLWKKQ